MFYKCVSPFAKCLRRCRLLPAFVTYQNDEGSAVDEGEEYCIKGARGMNQVLIEAATAGKSNANNFFRNGAYDQAASMYLQALALLQAMSRFDEDSEEDLALMHQAQD